MIRTATLRRSLAILGLALFMVTAFAENALATHFRYGVLTWQVTNPAQPNVVTFRLDSAWRMSFYPAAQRVVGASTNPFGNIRIFSGSSQIVPTFSVNGVVTDVNPLEDWMVTTTTFTRTFPAGNANYAVVFETCCRISTLPDGNNDRPFFVWTGVTVTAPPQTINRPPVSGSLPMILVPHGTIAQFTLPAFDPDGDALQYSIAPQGPTTLNPVTQTSGLVTGAPAGLSINQNTGVVTWNTQSPIVLNRLYAVQFRVRDGRGAYTSIDVLLRPVANVGLPPTVRINGAAAPAAFSVVTGNSLSFGVDGTDPEGQVVTLTSSGVPSGATMSPSLPTSGTGFVGSTFTWTPAANQIGAYQVNFAAVDGVGLQGTLSATIIVSNNPPTIVCTPSGGTIEATSPAGAVWSISADVDDEDGDSLQARVFVDGVQQQLSTVNPPPGTVAFSNTFGLGTHTYEVRVTDSVSAVQSCSGTFDIVDTTGPSITTPGDISVTGSTAAGEPVGFSVTATDVVDAAPTVACVPASGSTFAYGTSMVSCSASDFSGNDSTATFTVTVTDPTPPVIVPTVTGTPGSNGWYTSDVTVSWAVSDAESGIAASTGCDAVVVSMDTSGVTFTCSATNGDGVSASETVTVKVDTVAPAATFQVVTQSNGDGTIEATSPNGAVVEYSATATDLTSGVATGPVCSPASGSLLPLGTTAVACLTVDAAGNEGMQTFQVTVVDTTAPLLTVPGDMTLFGDTPAGAVVTFSATATDAVTVVVPVVCLPASGSTFAYFTTTVSCSATDEAGNTSAVQSFTVTVVDPTPPVIVPTVTGAPGSNGWFTSDVSVSWAVSDPETGIVSRTGCDAVVVNTDTAGVTFTCSATNGEGLSHSETVTVKVDTVAPTATFQNTSMTHPDGTVEATSSQGAFVTFSATATDLTSGVATGPTCFPASGSVLALGTTTVTCLTVDAAGNESMQDFQATVVDTTPPGLLPPDGTHPNLVAEATSAAGAVVSYVLPVIQDVADPNPVTTCLPVSGSTFPLGTTQVTCTASDASGNSAQYDMFTVTVQDTIAPVLTVPADITLFGDTPAGAVVTFSATATDAVTAAVTVVCLPASGSTFAYGTTTVSCTATDNIGNTSAALSFTVTVEDATPPVIVPAVTGTLGSNGWYTSDVSVAWAVSDAESGIATSTGCDVMTLPTDSSGTTFTCEATNGAGLTATASVDVTRDVTRPSLTVSGDLTVDAVDASGAPVSYAAPVAADATSGLAGAAVCLPASGSTFPTGTTTVTCAVADNAGNTSEASFTVTVVDTTAPVVSSVTPSTGMLWPPNHRMVPVSLAVVATDNVDAAPMCSITGVTSSEAGNGRGDGNTTGDAVITGPLTVELRSERAGPGNGRTYAIEVTCTDAAGNASTGTTTVSAPKSQGRGR